MRRLPRRFAAPSPRPAARLETLGRGSHDDDAAASACLADLVVGLGGSKRDLERTNKSTFRWAASIRRRTRFVLGLDLVSGPRRKC